MARRVQLDLRKLLGFRAVGTSASFGAKAGAKPGVKVGVKAGAKIGVKG